MLQSEPRPSGSAMLHVQQHSHHSLCRLLGVRSALPHNAPRAPILLQHSPPHQIQPTAVDPFAVACESFSHESQTLWNSATTRVPHAAMDGHPMQAQIVEQVVHQALAAARYDALALVALLDPVADAAIPVGPVDGMAAY